MILHGFILTTCTCFLFYKGLVADIVSSEGGVGDASDVGHTENDRVVEKDSLSQIVFDLQVKLASQERRIMYLEGRDKRNARVLKKVTSRVTTLENERHVQKQIPGEERNIINNYKAYSQDYWVETSDIKDQDSAVTMNFKRQKIRHNAENVAGNFKRQTIRQTAKKVAKNFKRQMIRQTAKNVARNFKRQMIRQTAKNVAFMSFLDHYLDHMSTGHTIKPNRVLLNDGNGYSSLTGIFTVPVSGVYMFNYHYNSNDHYTVIRLSFDGGEQVDAVTSPHNGYNAMGGNTAIVKAIQGQNIWLEIASASDGEITTGPIRRYCTFSGVLLYESL